jgi:hypothetical protein
LLYLRQTAKGGSVPAEPAIKILNAETLKN